MYTEDEMLMLSGIQHYKFCPRQWALIHIEQQWEENKLTMNGRILHEDVDNPFYRQKNGNVYKGYWKPYPVEYKRGHHKPDERDEVQLTAQVICLEEMYGVNIPYGALYYNEVKRREVISISDSLRAITKQCAEAMHDIFKSGMLPEAFKAPHCKNCSIKDICLPEVADCSSVSTYLKGNLYEDTT